MSISAIIELLLYSWGARFMRYEHISNIKKKDLLLCPSNYLWLEVSDEYSNANFLMLLNFIDKNIDCGKKHKYGNAYFAIRKEANIALGAGLFSPRKAKISKREIKSILCTTVKKNNGNFWLKIPYKISYIFRAVIVLVNKIEQENGVPLPPSLYKTAELAYGIAFYKKHIDTYDAKYDELQANNIDKIGYHLKVELNNDFHSESSIFKTIVR